MGKTHKKKTETNTIIIVFTLGSVFNQQKTEKNILTNKNLYLADMIKKQINSYYINYKKAKSMEKKYI